MKLFSYKSTAALFIGLLAGGMASAREKHPATGAYPAAVPKTGLDFIENKGQWDEEARYKAEIPGGALFLTKDGFMYNFQDQGDWDAVHEAAEHGKGNVADLVVHGHAYRIRFVGANTGAPSKGAEKRSTYHNYFIGNDSTKWAGNVGLYGTVTYTNLYANIDMQVYSKSINGAKYDLLVKPGGNPADIQLSFDGIDPTLDKEGKLHYKSSVNEVVESAPYSYQIINGVKTEVASKFKLVRGKLSFEFPNGYDATKELVIDPTLIYCSYSGATSGTYYAHSTTFDQSGNTYTAALALGAGNGWPVTTGAYQTSYPSTAYYAAASIMKINSTGSAIIYATYFGGSSGSVQPNTLRVDANGELYMAGNTSSSTMPTTGNAFQTTMSGSSDIYLVHFNAAGSSILGSTYLGGSGYEALMLYESSAYTGLGSSGNPNNTVEIAFRSSGTVWLTSNTGSSDFPVTTNAIQDTLGGGMDAVICELTSNCANLLYSTYFGGSGWDGGLGIELNESNSYVTIAGGTGSSKLPGLDSTSLHNTNQGGYDGFVARFDPASYANYKTTFLGTAYSETAMRIAYDDSGYIYIAGRSLGASYPITTGAYSIGNGVIFLQKLDTALHTSLASTHLGPSLYSSSTSYAYEAVPTAMMVDECGYVFLATVSYYAYSNSSLPVTADAFLTSPRPFWLCTLTPNFGGLYFGTYYGASADHFHPGVGRMDVSGNVYQNVCYSGSSNSSVSTPNSFSPAKLNGSTNDNVTFKFRFDPSGVHSDFTLDTALNQNDTGCAPYTVSFTNFSLVAQEYLWDFGDGTTSTAAAPTHTFTTAGHYTVTLYAFNDTACITNDTSYMEFEILSVDYPQLVASNDTLLCKIEPSLDLFVTILNPTANNVIEWQPSGGVLTGANSTNASVDPSYSEVYWVTVKDTIAGFCSFSTTDTIHIDFSPRILNILTPDTTVCAGSGVAIAAEATDGYTFRWVPGTGVSDTTALTPTITATQPLTTYQLTASYPGCLDTSVFINIGMEEIPVVDLGPDISLCQGKTVPLESSVTPFTLNYTYQWSPAGSNLSSATTATTYFTADTSGVWYLDVYSPVGCHGRDSIAVNVYPGAFGDITADTGYCPVPGAKAQLLASGGTDYAWSPAYGLSDTTIANPVANPGVSTTYTVLIKNQYDCYDTETVTVKVYAEATLTIPDTVTVYPGEPYQVEPGTNALYFKWFPPSGLSADNVSNPLMSPSINTRYHVTATTEYGCSVTDSMDVLVSPTLIDMPNAYAPTSNYTFKPVVKGMVALKSFVIYDRWGTKIYSSSDINEGWDGTFNGAPQPMGVYVYTIEGVTSEGSVFAKSGNVTLVR
ncbi:MAG: PKD domain-containing protein [Edaphocola sp.]